MEFSAFNTVPAPEVTRAERIAMKNQEEIIAYIQKTEKNLRKVHEELRHETKYMALKERFESMHCLMEDMMETLEIPKLD